MLIEEMDRDRLVELCKRWERAHCGVGICGSEYYADPERVFAAVRAHSDALHKALVRAKGSARHD
jgi:hypothetical protein